MKNSSLDITKLDNIIKRFDYIDKDLTKAYFTYMLTHQKIVGKIESYLNRFDLTSTQVSILLLLSVNEKNYQTPGVISKKLGLSNPTISNVIKTLNKKQFLKKEVSPKDRRYCNISITPAGLDFLDRVMSEYYLIYEKLLKDFSDEELENLDQNSLKIFYNLDFL